MRRLALVVGKTLEMFELGLRWNCLVWPGNVALRVLLETERGTARGSRGRPGDDRVDGARHEAAAGCVVSIVTAAYERDGSVRVGGGHRYPGHEHGIMGVRWFRAETHLTANNQVVPAADAKLER